MGPKPSIDTPGKMLQKQKVGVYHKDNNVKFTLASSTLPTPPVNRRPPPEVESSPLMFRASCKTAFFNALAACAIVSPAFMSDPSVLCRGLGVPVTGGYRCKPEGVIGRESTGEPITPISCILSGDGDWTRFVESVLFRDLLNQEDCVRCLPLLLIMVPFLLVVPTTVRSPSLQYRHQPRRR